MGKSSKLPETAWLCKKGNCMPAEHWPSAERLLDIAHAARDLVAIIRDSVPTTELFSQRDDEDADYWAVQAALGSFFGLVYELPPNFAFVAGPGKGGRLVVLAGWLMGVQIAFRTLWNTVAGLAVYFGRCRPDASGQFAIQSVRSWTFGPNGYERNLEPVKKYPPLAQMGYDDTGRMLRRVDKGLEVGWLDRLQSHAARLEANVLAIYPELALPTSGSEQKRAGRPAQHIGEAEQDVEAAKPGGRGLARRSQKLDAFVSNEWEKFVGQNPGCIYEDFVDMLKQSGEPGTASLNSEGIKKAIRRHKSANDYAKKKASKEKRTKGRRIR